VSYCEMLFGSSLVALVGGSNEEFSARQLQIEHTQKKDCYLFQKLSYAHFVYTFK